MSVEWSPVATVCWRAVESAAPQRDHGNHFKGKVPGDWQPGASRTKWLKGEGGELRLAFEADWKVTMKRGSKPQRRRGLTPKNSFFYFVVDTDVFSFRQRNH